ncbi:FYVE, RhoGEF and PH domain-containing protein 3 [Anoplophora glabripennis]|uniref:FYVE, RhoGEF and PH domain-containing protein 3 n=1 Tax=Anoplophora glabripennis TaxID=217634 RepID=UPI000873A322|nr:FYVE, RhoGEF and PH domain-containing protein 3 [Anoplophora glabripennis]
MEQNLKQCRIILEPIILENNINTQSNAPKCQKNEEQNTKNNTTSRIKFHNISELISAKDVTYNLTEKSVTSCFVELENVKIENSIKCDKLDIVNTPQTTSKCKKSKQPQDNGIPFEPVTPKAHIEFSLELKKAINERNILTSKTKKHVFEALDEIKNKTEEARRTFKKEKAVLEIVNSEIKYVHQLEIIINFFMKPIKEHNLLKPDDYGILFSNIYTIYNVNKELLDELDKGVGNIATAFSKIAPFLKLYSVYAYEFKDSLKILQNARLLNPQFANFIENQETRPEIQNKLSALLITPIQRVPRYKLLLTNLYNLTKPSEEGFDVLSDCLHKIEEVAEHINNLVEDQEIMQRLLEFQRCLRGEPNIIIPGRKLMKEGILTKMSSKNGHSEKLYVVLMNDIIMFSKMKKDEPKVNSLKCFSIFPLNKCKIIEILDKGCLKVICQDEELILYHEQFNETKNWIKTIKETIDDHLKDRKTLRKESSARRPVKRKDLYEYHEVGLSPGRPLKKKRLDLDIENTNSMSNHKISRRRPIRSTSEKINGDTSLPCSLIVPEITVKNSISGSSQKVSDLAKDLYVFGKPADNTGFRLGKFFGGMSSTIKRFLGFRN